MPDQATRGVCFVVMGFGKKTDFETGRTLDLDKTYKNIIKPAAEAARLKCVRADEIVHSGLIDLPMYEQLLTADVVVADLSTSNKNAFYELGVRHALRPHTTIIIAEDGMKAFPFDVNHVLVRQYHHLGEDIGYSEVIRFRDQLTQAMNEILDSDPPKDDSPIYTILHGLTPPLRAEQTRSRGGDVSSEIAPPAPAPQPGGSALSYNALMEQVDDAEDRGDFVKATTLLGEIRTMLKAADANRPEDPTLVQRHAFAAYKSEHPSRMEAYAQASDILKVLNPETSNDTATLGLWGAIQKRFWNETQDRSYLDQAVRAYSRGFYLRNDYYNGINYAYLLNVRGINAATRAEAIADFVEAARIRREVISICEALLEKEQVSEANQYWIRVTMAEAYLGIEDEENCKRKLEEAEAFSPVEWMRKTTDRRLESIRGFLAQSPLKELSEE
ncbi:MAG TPA: TRAFs-binding domain-containing protein [Pyrinomonadaceae bacterium]|nr:TRAFs-binding domain-containing protein [Pyrinomonadaceae bacterium]